MIKKATFFVNNFLYLDNEVFNLKNKRLNRDNCLLPGVLLKYELEKQGFDLCTQDINPIIDSEFVIYSDLPSNHTFENPNSYLIIWESEVIINRNWDKKNFKYFKKIFTWNDEYVDNDVFFKINFPHHLIREDLEKKSSLCCLVAGNKVSSHPNELYSKRLEVIKWFEKHKPSELDLYGPNWDKLVLENRYLNYISFKLNLKVNNKVYRGLIGNKTKDLGKYKFSICFENAKGYPGYITEKIFDCFCSNIVPVYMGPPNILDYIPGNCFINYNSFDTINLLVDFLEEMSDATYNEYLKNINNFLNSDSIKQFSIENFVSVITKNIET